jgi:OTU domain-containing protein 6
MEDSDTNLENECIARHKKENKDLQAQIQQLKHAVPKGDKKKKKDVAAQIAILEAELQARHEKELFELKASHNASVDTVPSEAIPETNNSSEGITAEDITAPENLGNNLRKPSKAQRRKAKKDQKLVERTDRIKEQDLLNESSARNIEAEKLKVLLRSRGLTLFEIAADGNCLFSAIEDQLRQRTIETSVGALRHQTAQFMSTHRDEFLPFLVHEATGELYSEGEFGDYCKRVESTSEWGGQVEIRALSEVLKTPVEVIQADGPCVTIGEHFPSSPLRIVYHRHFYRLGEHYNSARPLRTAAKDNVTIS